ncbi:MAG: hypothetical protein KAT04_07500 [Methylococcales bacterium]|nr:hypothetical protein [Methylococcales bacterium]
MTKKIIDDLIDQPLLTSIFVVDFAILLLHRPPVIFSIVMMGYIICMSMYYGQKFRIYKNL